MRCIICGKEITELQPVMAILNGEEIYCDAYCEGIAENDELGDEDLNDKLTQMFEMQAGLDNRIIKERGIEKSTSEWVTGLTIAMESEIDEIRREINWKWWKNEKEIDEAALQGEVIDLWHFLLSMSRVVGLTPETIYETYMAKNAENHARQSGQTDKDGYDAGAK